VISAAAKAASSAPLGGHLWHLVAIVAPLVVALIVVIIERLRAKPATREEHMKRPAVRAVLTAEAFGVTRRQPVESQLS
jgi:hypothetical protein